MSHWGATWNEVPFGVVLKDGLMHSSRTLDRLGGIAKPKNVIWFWRIWAWIVLPALLCILATPARAVDGCKVLLCLAAPSWRSIPECVPTINQLHRDLATGKPFPTCSMAGDGNSANNAWASAPTNCPPQYTRVVDGESGSIYSCDYVGAVTVSINGAPFTRSWWSMGGDTVTEFTPAAKAQLGTWDSKFDDDFATWVASQPPPAPPCPTC